MKPIQVIVDNRHPGTIWYTIGTKCGVTWALEPANRHWSTNSTHYYLTLLPRLHALSRTSNPTSHQPPTINFHRPHRAFLSFHRRTTSSITVAIYTSV